MRGLPAGLVGGRPRSRRRTLDHRFAELEGGAVGRALQTLQFRLDRGGVELEAEAKVLFKSNPARYVVDGPFLIVLRLRGTTRP